MMSRELAEQCTVRLIGLAVFLQTLEQGALRKCWRWPGPWAWERLRPEFQIWGVVGSWVFDRVLSDRGFLLVLLVQAILSAVCAITGQLIFCVPLFLTTFLCCLRWRGTFNGGSDYMTMVILLSLALAWVFRNFEAATSVALGYIAIQVLLSYFVAGVVKLKEPEWRDGRALSVFLTAFIPEGDVPLGQRPGLQSMSWFFSLVQQLSALRGLCAVLGWGILIFELSAPSLLLASDRPQVVAVWLMGAAVFHFMNALVLGLNRFFWAWIAGYPAVFWLILSGLK